VVGPVEQTAVPNSAAGIHATAHADEVKQQTHLVAQFGSGHTGWIKIALEKDPSTDKAVERLEDPDPSNLARGVLLAAFARPRMHSRICCDSQSGGEPC
jgi:hypothetical protein